MTSHIICSNPNEIRLTVTVDLTIGEWRQIVASLAKAPYYGPLEDLTRDIELAIKAIESREPIKLSLEKQE